MLDTEMKYAILFTYFHIQDCLNVYHTDQDWYKIIITRSEENNAFIAGAPELTGCMAGKNYESWI